MSTSNDHVHALVDDYLHYLLPAEEAVRVEAHCAACAECRAALEEAKHRRDALVALPAREASPQLLDATLQRIEQHKRRRRRTFRRYALGSLAGLAAAVLVLLGLQAHYAFLAPTPADLIVLGQYQLMAATPASLRIQLIDRLAHRPLSGVPIKVELQRGKEVIEVASLATNDHGTAQPRFELPDWDDGDCRLHVRAQTAKGEEHVIEKIELKRSWKLMLTSDKPLYQPGQTIQARALALRRPDLHPVSSQNALFTLTDPKGNVLFKEQARTSPFGIAATRCLLDTEVAEGTYTLACKLGNTESPLAVEVKKYVLPNFKLDVRPDRAFYAPSETAKLAIQAGYFFGKPVAGGEVKVEVLGTLPDGKPLSEVTGRTDGKGQVSIACPLPAGLPGREDLLGDAQVSFRVTVTDAAGQKQTRSVDRVVTEHPVRIEVIPEGKTLVRGVANRVYLFVVSADGTPVEARVWIEGRREPLRTDKHGLASLEVTPNSGLMNLTLMASDDTGKRLASRSLTLTVGQADGDFLLRTDRAVYDAGNTLTLTALGGGSGPVFVDFLRDGQTLLTQTVAMADGKGELKFDLPPELAGTIQVCAYRFDANGHPLRRTRVLHVRPAGDLKIRTTLDAREYRPGSKAVVNFAVTDATGKPAPGALSLVAVDEAVFSVLAQRPGLERAFFSLERELLEPVYTIYPWTPEVREDQLEQAVFAAAASSEDAPRRKGIDSSLASVHSLTADTFDAKAATVSWTRQNGAAKVTAGWVLLGGVALLLLYIGLWFVIRVEVMIASSAALVFPLVVVVALLAGRKEAKFMTALTEEGFVEFEATNSMKQAGIAIHNASDAYHKVPAAINAFFPAENPPAPPASPPLRSYFPETLLWKPELITDDQGRAHLEISLADSITTWRLSASAVTADGRLGAAHAGIKVFQPFFADLDLPVSLTRGDEVSVPVVVHNHLDKAQTVTLTLSPTPWFRLLGDGKQQIKLGAGEVRSIHFPVRVEKVGNHELSVKAEGAGVADALVRRIEVVPDGHRIEQVAGGILDRPAEVRLDLPKDVIEGSAKAVLKIYPSSFSQLVEGLDNIFQMPHGCFEQTSSTTYPNVLALDYLRRTKRSALQVEAKARQYIHLGYQRLVGFEVPGGGFDWFGRPPANLTLTAYGLMEFEDMARVHDVDRDLIERTRRWLLKQRQADGSWQEKGSVLHDDPARAAGADQHDLATTAYVGWAVFARGNAAQQAAQTQSYLLGHKPEAIGDLHVLALVCNALLALDPSGAAAAPYCDRLAAQAQTSADGCQAWWVMAEGNQTTFYGAGEAGTVETTALAALALLDARRHPGTASRALAWLMAHKDPHGTWHSTQATVLSLRALLAGTTAPVGEGDRRIEVHAGGKVIEELTIPAAQAEVLRQVDLTPHLAAGVTALTLADRSGSGAGYQVAFRYHLPGPGPQAAEAPLTIALNYDRTEVRVDETLQATVKASTQMRQPAAMVMLDLPIPPGFAPITDDFTALVQSGAIARYQVRPRQVLVYLRGLDLEKPVKFTYRLRATMPVMAAVPGAHIYEYYDPQREGRSQPTRLSVKAGQ
jgi:uncharacterized protein YfaS (alpha-2-macroglobulin family)